MLEIRPNCENCDKDLPPNANDAMVCSFECTFCRACVEGVLINVCPNCGGGFMPRPVRPTADLRNGHDLASYPASTTRVVRPVDPGAHAKFAASIRNIRPANR